MIIDINQWARIQQARQNYAGFGQATAETGEDPSMSWLENKYTDFTVGADYIVDALTGGHTAADAAAGRDCTSQCKDSSDTNCYSTCLGTRKGAYEKTETQAHANPAFGGFTIPTWVKWVAVAGVSAYVLSNVNRLFRR